MEEYNVRISATAQNDFMELAKGLATLSYEEELQYYDDIIESTKVLLTAPDTCPFAKDSQLRLRRYRLLNVHNYTYFFVISGTTVEIRRILHSKRQYERIL